MDKINKDIFSDRIKKVRNLMAKNNVDAYLIPMSDPHGSEMLDAHYHEISFLTGFTGSAGDVLITKDEGFLWTDSRYFLQAAEQLPPEIKLMKLGYEDTELYDKLIHRYNKAGTINTLAVDMGVYTTSAFSVLSNVHSAKPTSPTSVEPDSSKRRLESNGSTWVDSGCHNTSSRWSAPYFLRIFWWMTAVVSSS